MLFEEGTVKVKANIHGSGAGFEAFSHIPKL
jgi:hypothetical protein